MTKISQKLKYYPLDITPMSAYPKGHNFMAKEEITRLIDDLDGGRAAETVAFQIDGQPYEIDLSARNAAKLRRDLAPFISAARKEASEAKGKGRGTQPTSAAARRHLNQQIRSWAQANGITVAARGRIAQDVVDAYRRDK